jgi:hypothetical protein
MWVLAATSIVLLLGAGGLGLGYFAARSAVVDRNSQITELQGDLIERDDTIEERDEQLEQAQQQLADVETQLADAQACVDSMQEFVDLPATATEAELDRVVSNMFDICGFR